MSNLKLKVLFHAFDDVGHVNPCIGVAKLLQIRGHTIVFVSTIKFKALLENLDFLCEYLDDVTTGGVARPVTKPGEALMKAGMFRDMSTVDKMMTATKSPVTLRALDMVKLFEPRMKRIVAHHQPDLIVIDHFVPSPSLTCGHIPWAFILSSSSLSAGFPSPHTPPCYSGEFHFAMAIS